MGRNWVCALFIICAIGNVCSVDETTKQSMTVQQFSSNKDTALGVVKLATKSVTTQRLESTILTDPTSPEVIIAETTVTATELAPESTTEIKVTKPELVTTDSQQLEVQTTADALTAAPSETQTVGAATTTEERPDSTERETAALRAPTAPVMAMEERQSTVAEKKTSVKVIETTEVVTEGLTTAEAMATESQDSAATTAYGWSGAEDPCDPSVPINMTGDQRHFTQVGASKHCDSAVENGYYRFLHQGEPAVIPTECIRGGYCSTDHPIRIDLEGKTMPTVVGQSVKVHSCLYTIVAGKPDCCSVRNKAVITKCDNYYVYYLQKVDRCNVGFCIKLPHETISKPFIGSRNIGPLVVTTTETIQEVTTTLGNGKKIHAQVKNTKKPLPSKPYRVVATTQHVITTREHPSTAQRTTVGVETTGARKTTAKQLTQQLYPTSELSPNQRSNIVTFVFSFNDAKALERFDNGLRRALIAILLGRTRMRVRRDAYGPALTDDVATFTIDGVKFVYKSVGNGTVELSLFVQNGTNSEDVVPVDRLLNYLNNTNSVDYLETQLNMTLVSVKAGLPASNESPSGTEEKRKSIFEAHLGLWIVILVLACICIVCILIAVFVLKCCQHRWNKKTNLADKEQMPLEEGPQGVTESPLSDEEIMKDELAPQLEARPNGNGVPAKHMEEENGWVVPMEELDPPDVEDTKL